MDKSRKRLLTSLIALVVLGVLVWLQFRAYRRFDWAKFRAGTAGIHWLPVLSAVLLIYVADFLRAVRWKIFLRPSKPDARWAGLVAPQYVGFAGLALLGRPGEFIRPYLIALKENQSVPSQIAIWFVERAFDIGAITIILSIDLLLVPTMRDAYPEWRKAAYALIAAFLGLVVLLWQLSKHGPTISRWVCRKMSRFSEQAGTNMEKKLLAVSAGLRAVRDWISFFEVAIISLGIWLLVAMAYRQVTHAYPIETGLPDLELAEVILLMGASVAGGVVQLPVVGGGSQLATIAVLGQTFGYEPELAVSCGILLWLVTFMSVTPLGLLLARFEHLSIRKLGHESEEEVEQETSAGPPGSP